MFVLMSLMVFGCVACLVWGLCARPTPMPRRSVRSLRSSKTPAFIEGLGAVGLRWRQSLRAIAAPGASSTRLESLLGDRLRYAGSRMKAGQFYGIKVLSAAAGCFVWSTIAIEQRGLSPVWFGVAAAMGFLGPDLWLRIKRQQRHRAIIRLMPEAIDLLTLCLGAGLDFLGSLQKVVGIGSLQREPLVEELGLALRDIQLGKSRVEALKAMAHRIDLPELSSFVRTLAQADRMGTPLLEALSIHGSDLREQRFTRAERAVLKAPIKILFPLIFCIMPSVALIVGAPVLMQFLRQNPFGR